LLLKDIRVRTFGSFFRLEEVFVLLSEAPDSSTVSQTDGGD
jgi:hypothetical protein